MNNSDETRRFRQLTSRLDRLALGLDVARGMVLLGVFICVLVVVVVITAALQPWLVVLPRAWGGVVAVVMAAIAAWWAVREMRQSWQQGRRLAISRRLEAAHPELGERISRVIGFAPQEPLPSDAPLQDLAAITQQLERAALREAAEALQGIDGSRWLRSEPVVIAAAVVLSAAVLAVTGLAASLASLPSWRQAVAWQLGLVASHEQAEPSGPRGRDSEPQAATAGEGGVHHEAAESPSVEQVTLAAYRRVSALAATWQQLAAETSQAADPSAKAELVATTRDATRDAARQAAGELARLRGAADRQQPAGSAMVLQALAQRLAQAADEASAAMADDIRLSATRAAASMVAAVDLAQAAAGIAEAAHRSDLLATWLAAEAVSTAGRDAAELPAALQTWLETVAGLAADMHIGTLSDRDTLGSILDPSAWPQPACLAVLPTDGTADAIRANRLFVAARSLTNDAEELAAAAAILGMPALDDDAGWSTAALARRRLRTIVASAARPDDKALGLVDAMATTDAATGLSPVASPVAAAAASTAEGLASDDQPSTSAATSGQPTGGEGMAMPVQPRAQPATATQIPMPVWIPPAPDAREPLQPRPAPREPPAAPGYFRRLDAALPLSRSWHAGGGDDRVASIHRWVDAWLGSSFLVASLAFQAADQAGDEAPDDETLPLREQPDAAAASSAVARGIDWLVRVQRGDGSWGSQRFVGSVAVTSHGLLALASTGSTPAAGPHAEAADRALGFLLDNATASGLIAANEVGANGPMYGHAYAIQALAELSGEASRPEITAVLTRGCRLLEQTQNTEGGWRYQPRRGDADISVTSAVVVALEAAAAAGIDIAAETIDRGTAYITRLRNEDGGFRYQDAAGPSGSARTAAALVALAVADPRQQQLLAAGRRWLGDHPQQPDPTDGYAAYGRLASSTAAWHESPAAWARWYRETAPELLAAQRADGSWDDPSCPEYGTSAAILALTAANGLLPGFQRGQRGGGP